MFSHNPTYSSDFPFIFPDTTTFSSPLTIPGDRSSHSAVTPEFGNTSSSSYGTGSPTCFGGAYTAASFIHRSISSHSLLKNSHVTASSPPTHFEPPVMSSIRRVLSTGDLQGVNLAHHNQRSSNLSSTESSIIESMSRASPYSPEEKKERIERYRSKRNLRNFNKKIKYECRKTLADSRPRIRGRFARNGEIEKTPRIHWEDNSGVEEDYEDDDNWINYLDPFSTNFDDDDDDDALMS